jgi:hypothetical protein
VIAPPLRAAAALALAAALATGAATPAQATEGERWSPDLTTAERSGILISPDGLRLDPAGAAGAERLGLATLPPRGLHRPADRVVAQLDADVPAGTAATVDVRGRDHDGEWGEWGEWVPLAANGQAALPEPAAEVQSRVVLTGTSTATPVVRAVEFTALPVHRTRLGTTRRPTLGYRVFATREGLIGGITTNGHVITEDDHFVALPSRRALAPKATGDYSVRVCTTTTVRRKARCGYAPVWDVGPWNTRDDYWNPRRERQDWDTLPQGVPQAQVAHLDGFNDGRDQFDREVLNPAGIDLSDALFDDLGLTDNAWVRVDYLWTGSEPLATVRADSVPVRAAADEDADVVGVAGGRARVPAECRISTADGTWLRIGDRQYLPAESVTWKRRPPMCATAQRRSPGRRRAGAAAG